MMRDIHFDVQLAFETNLDRKHSEDILMRLLGTMSRMNLMYLSRNPETKLLYDSGVVYEPPDQTTAPDPSASQTRRLFSVLRDIGVTPETALKVLRVVRGTEVFLDIPRLYSRGCGDCNEVVPVRIAELWRAGVGASPYITKQRNSRGGWTYHVVVKHPDGSSEDTSLILGMGGAERAAERAEEIRKNRERLDNYVSAARVLAVTEGAPLAELNRKIDLMGFVPKSGEFAGGVG